MRNTTIKLASLLAAALLLAVQTATAQTPDFERDVYPILKSRCVECHGAPYKDARGKMKFAKAGLRLDGKDHILAGEVIVPKSPQTSTLVEFISLPAGDSDIMPPKGAPLTKDQVQTIYNWVNDGADFGKWTGEARTAMKTTAAVKPGAMPKNIKLLHELGAGLKPLEVKALKAILPGRARIESVYTGSGLLRVTLLSSVDDAGNEDLKALAPIASRIAQLNLSSTKVDDKGLKYLAKMSKLVRLDLHKTAVTDGGMAAIKGLNQLRYLNLYGTKVSDQGLPHLTMLKRLDSIYLWQTGVTDAGVKRLAQMLPKAKVSHKLVLPEPPTEAAPRRRRRNN